MTRHPSDKALAILIALALSVASGCGKTENPWPEGKSPRVLVSFPPLYCFAVNVAGDDAAVLSLLKTTGPHDFQPTTHDTLKLRRADLFFVNGLELDEHFAKRLKNNSGNSGLPLIELGERVKNKIAIGKEKEDGHDHKHDGHAHHHGEYDPHMWLGIPEAIVYVQAIRDELKAKNPADASGYDRRAAEYIQKLEKLHADGKAALSVVKPADRKLISFHDSLRYFARAFDVQVAGVMEMRAGVAPDANELRKLIELCQKENVRVIAVEPQYPQDNAKLLRDSAMKKGVADVRIIEIDPIETAAIEEFGPDLYENKMRANIEQLQKAWK